MKRVVVAVVVALAGMLGPGSSAVASGISGAPRSQHDGDFVASGLCPLAAPNRYLPPRSGCAAVHVADVDGDGRPDLVILYSHLTLEHVDPYPGEPPSWRHRYVADAAYLRVVLARGGVVTARIPQARAAALLGLAHGADPGVELFLQVQHISSGDVAVAYGFAGGRLVSAGVYLGFGGDSGAQSGFDCSGKQVVSRSFVNDHSTINGTWQETQITLAWHGPKLVKVARRKLEHHGFPPRSQTEVGRGCQAAGG